MRKKLKAKETTSDRQEYRTQERQLAKQPHTTHLTSMASVAPPGKAAII